MRTISILNLIILFFVQVALNIVLMAIWPDSISAGKEVLTFLLFIIGNIVPWILFFKLYDERSFKLNWPIRGKNLHE
jgi:fatty-acid desaturase